MGCYNSCVIDKNIDEVWSTVRNFHDMSWAKGVIENLEIVGAKKGDQVGAGRLLNGVFHETLLELDEDECMIVYSIDEGPDVLSGGAVKGYRGVLQLSPITVGSGTFVEWSSSWRTDKQGVAEFCDPIYVALLSAMKDHFK
ncbi:MAG: SRPBCC family protein [Kordiimonadaceae bacterium]|jgi:hypothetical protein|nr:SRPBCC family protein [Kordiimonadaceae bacterium]